MGRVPSTAAVAITLQPGAKASMAEVISAARASIDVGELGISPGELRPKRAVTGGLIIEIAGERQKEKAVALASSMRATLARYPEAQISVPQKLAELRLSRIDESVTQAELAAALARCGECALEEVRVGEVKLPPYGLGTAWVRCPVAAAKKAVAAGRLVVGWSLVVVTPLEARPLQCFKCLAFGHVRAKCPVNEDRGTRCFGCGSRDHLRAQCPEKKAACFLCREGGHDANHRMGGANCRALQESRRRRPPVGGKEAASAGKSGDGPFKKPAGKTPKKKKVVTAGATPASGATSMEVEA